MSSFEVALEGTLPAQLSTDEQVSGTFDALMASLVDLGAVDPFVGGSLVDRAVTISAVFGAASQTLALADARSLFRTAIAKIGLSLTGEAHTPSWSSTLIRPEP